MRLGKPRGGQGGRCWGCGGKSKKQEGSPEEGGGGAPGTGGPCRGAGKGGVAEGGPSEGEEKREFKLLTLLVFFK